MCVWGVCAYMFQNRDSDTAKPKENKTNKQTKKTRYKGSEVVEEKFLKGWNFKEAS